VGDGLNATVVFHAGPRFAPVINGLYTPYDLPILTERAALAQKLKDLMVFHWPMHSCTFHEGLRFECYDTDDVEAGRNGEQVRPTALYTTRVEEDGIAGKTTTLRVNLSFTVDGQGDPALTMDYPIGDCESKAKPNGVF
jgi:hypothetical protein